jgi:hypothetical protein
MAKNRMFLLFGEKFLLQNLGEKIILQILREKIPVEILRTFCGVLNF